MHACGRGSAQYFGAAWGSVAAHRAVNIARGKEKKGAPVLEAASRAMIGGSRFTLSQLAPCTTNCAAENSDATNQAATGTLKAGCCSGSWVRSKWLDRQCYSNSLPLPFRRRCRDCAKPQEGELRTLDSATERRASQQGGRHLATHIHKNAPCIHTGTLAQLRRITVHFKAAGGQCLRPSCKLHALMHRPIAR